MLELLIVGLTIMIVVIGVLRMASKAYWKYQIALLKAKGKKVGWKQMIFGKPPQEYLDLIEELHTEKERKPRTAAKRMTEPVVEEAGAETAKAVEANADEMDEIPNIPDPDPDAVPDDTFHEDDMPFVEEVMKEFEQKPEAEQTSKEKPKAAPKKRGRKKKSA